MKILLSILLYLCAFIFAPIVLAFYGEWKMAAIAAVAYVTGVFTIIGAVLGVVIVWQRRHGTRLSPSERIAAEVTNAIANARVTHTP